MEKLTDYIEQVGLMPSPLADEYRYASLPICVIDAVFSIGVRYSTTDAVVRHFCAETGWRRLTCVRDQRQLGERTLSDFVALYRGIKPDAAAERFYQNRQRTSSKSGILKAEAVLMFAQNLICADIETFNDLSSERLALAEAMILGLPGQSSGIAFDYFKMLAGDDNIVKPDRMVQRFVAKALNLSVEPSPRRTSILVQLAAQKLNYLGYEWTPLQLDHAIWLHQSGDRGMES